MGFPMIYHLTVYTITQGQRKIMQSKNGVFAFYLRFLCRCHGIPNFRWWHHDQNFLLIKMRGHMMTWYFIWLCYKPFSGGASKQAIILIYGEGRRVNCLLSTDCPSSRSFSVVLPAIATDRTIRKSRGNGILLLRASVNRFVAMDNHT